MASRFNPPPGWPVPPQGWSPPPGWEPDPSWPPAPQGWQLWVDEPSDDGSSDSPVNLGGQDLYPQDRKPNRLLWLIPVAVLVVVGLVFGGLALAGVFKSDADDPVAAPVETTSDALPEDGETGGSPEASADPDEGDVDDFFMPDTDSSDEPGALGGLGELEDLDNLKDLLGGEKSTDPATPKFCADLTGLSEGMGGDGSDPEVMKRVLPKMQKLKAPAEIAEAWPVFLEQMSVLVDGGEPAVDSAESLLRVSGFIVANCSP